MFQGIARTAKVEVERYLPLPPARNKEFWTSWKIKHIRQLAQSGRATEELSIPESERTNRALDSLYLEPGEIRPIDSVNLRVPFVSDSSLELASPLYLGDMSFGALSGVPNIAIVHAADLTQTIAGTGEGGLLQEVADCSRITVQWASARFGVDKETLSKGQGVVIKIGQGAKPGIGGHLPGVKVTEPISETRRVPAGKDAISPAPHHDIYSIEDLGQRIAALKEATKKPVLVKVGATNYVPYIASGVARMEASGIIIDGAGAGTGAAPSVIKDNVGIPIEFAVASVDSALRREGTRDKFTIIAAGKVSTPEDSLKLIALGADITSLGTAALISLGCIMVHKCHLGYCPAVLTNKISANQAKVLSVEQSIRWVSNLVNGWSEEMRILLAYIGVKSVAELRGRRDLLRASGRLSFETLRLLGFSEDHVVRGSSVGSSSVSPSLWSGRRISMLREMAGTIGKTPGEAEISSMGSTSAPLIEEPTRISDWLVSDGAQVTRPSIDPYREEIETATFLSGPSLRLSSPFFFTHLPDSVPTEVKSVFGRVASSMGLLLDVHSEGDLALDKWNRVIVSEKNARVYPGAVAVSIEEFPADKGWKQKENAGPPVFLRLTSSREKIDKVVAKMNLGHNEFAGYIIDEDLGEDPLELTTPFLDASLKKLNLRHRSSILVESNAIRGSDDIFKLIALGCDAVGFGRAALLAIGYEEEAGSNVVFDVAKSRERLENFVLAIQKDLKLLAGAAGISNMQSSLVGNRELLRSLDLDPETRAKIGVKPAGSP